MLRSPMRPDSAQKDFHAAAEGLQQGCFTDTKVVFEDRHFARMASVSVMKRSNLTRAMPFTPTLK